VIVGVTKPPMVTVREVDPDFVVSLTVTDALMVAVPAALPVTSPWLPAVLLTIATFVEDEDQFTYAVRFSVMPVGNVPVAVHWSVAPTETVEPAQDTAMEETLESEPLPVRAAVCDPALSVTVRVPVCVPRTGDVMVTVMEQWPPAETVPAQPLLDTVKLPVAEAVKLRGVLRLLLSVIFLLAVVPTPTLPKFKVVVERLACGTPAPVSLMTCGLPEDELSKTETVAVKDPVAVGPKVKLMVQEALGTTEKLPVVGQGLVPLFGSAKGALGAVMPVTVRAAVPVLVRRTDLAALVVPTA
jgi:hypothetical protein